MANLARPPRELLARHLDSTRQSQVDFATRIKVDYHTVTAVMNGGAAPDPVGLHLIGKALKAPMGAWSIHLAALLLRVAPEDAAKRVNGLLWSYLITRSLTVDQAAAKHGTTGRALAITLRRGVVSDRIRQSTILAAIGATDFGEGQERSAHNPQLQRMVTDALAALKTPRRVIAREVGMNTTNLARIARGYVPHMISPASIGLMAIALKIDRKALAEAAAATYRTSASNRGSLKFLVVRHLFDRGLKADELATEAGVAVDAIRHIIDGKIPLADTLSKLKAELGATESEWTTAIAGQDKRRIAGSATYQSLASRVQPLHLMISQAADACGMTPTQWARQYGVAPSRVRAIYADGAVPRREEIRLALMRALNMDRASYDTACRLMAERHNPRSNSLDRLEAKSGVQEAVLRLLKQGMTPSALATSAGISRKTMVRVARYGAADFNFDTQERIRRLLGVDADTFEKMLEPIEAIDEIEDAGEMRLLVAYRRLPDQQRMVLLEVAGRLLAGQGVNSDEPAKAEPGG